MRQIDIVKAALAQRNINPNRALGQNFLIDTDAIARIIDASDAEGKLVVEIGPGLGALTQPLCAVASRVFAIEKDHTMAGVLTEALAYPKLTVLNKDFLDCNLTDLTQRQPYIAVGNLPYYVTTPIVEKLLTHTPDSMTLMVQTEAAERFFAQPGDRVYGPVAVLSQTVYASAHVLDVPRDSFFPRPEVDSTVVRLTRNLDCSVDGAAFMRYLKLAFAMRRKTLRNNLLAHHAGFDAALETVGLPAGIRAEAIEPMTLLRLYGMFADRTKA